MVSSALRSTQGAITFLNFIQELPIRIIGFDESELEKAKALVKKFADQKLTLADAHGLAIMRPNGSRLAGQRIGTSA